MIITCFVTNVYQLAVTRAVISFFQPQSATIVYCSEFINLNNAFLRYMGSLNVVTLVAVSEDGHKPKAGLFSAACSANFAPEVLERVLESDMVFFGDPYLLSQRNYVSVSKSIALIEDSPTLFSYFRHRHHLPTVRRWLAELFGFHPRFDVGTCCYGLSSTNNCPSRGYVNLLQVLDTAALGVIKSEIKNEFRTEFELVDEISRLNVDDTIMLLTQPLASDGIVSSVDQQIGFYMENIDRLRSNGFRVLCKLHPRDIANRVLYPIGSGDVFNFSSPMELFEDELRRCFVGIAAYSSYSFVESTKFARIGLSL